MDPKNRNLKPIVENEIENKIENNPVQVANDPLIPKEVKEEAKQILDNNPQNDEVNNEAVEEGIKSPGSSFLNRKDYLKARKPSDRELKKRLPKEPKLLNGLLRDIFSNDDYSSTFDDKVFEDPEPGDILDPIYQDLSNRYPDLKYSELASNPKVFKYFTEPQKKRDKRLTGSGVNLTGTSLEDLVDLLGDAYVKNPEKYTKEALEALIENKPEQVLEEPKMPEEAKEEAAQVLDSDKRNDEANNEHVEKALEKLSTADDLYSYLDQFGDEYGFVEEPDNKTFAEGQMISESNSLDANKLEQITESNPEAIQEALPDTPIAEEARQITDDGDTRNDEVNNQAAEETVSRLSDDFETVDDLYNYLENYGMGWNNGRVDDVDLNGPDFPVDNNVYAKDEDFVGPDEVVDYGLEDQNQYSTGIGNLDETVAQENVPNVNENDFVKSDVLPSADNVLELKPEERDAVTEAIEEAAPEEEKETYFGMLGIPHRQLSSSSPSSVNANNEQYKLDRLNHAGASSLGGLGGFSVGGGSVTPGTVSTGINKPRAMTERVSSRAGGGNIPKSPNAAANSQVGSRTGNSSNGFITSNGGSVSSGPVQKRSSLKSPKPTQLPNFTGHTAPVQTNQLGSAEDLHNALIERIKGMLDNLDAETRKKLGFSSTLYNYNGTPLDKLDGATLVQISEMLEDMQNG